MERDVRVREGVRRRDEGSRLYPRDRLSFSVFADGNSGVEENERGIDILNDEN